MKRINLTNGGITLVDDEDFDRLNQYSWCIRNKNARSKYACTTINNRLHSMSRIIMNVTDPKIQIDHINGNKLDNRKENLRVCTPSQNMQNKDKTSLNTSGYKGVSQHGKRWRAQIMVNSKQKHIGVYDTKKEAANAYDEAAIKYFGEFAKLNFTY